MGIACFFGKGGPVPPDRAASEDPVARVLCGVIGGLEADGIIDRVRAGRRMEKQNRETNRLEREIRKRKKALAV